MIIIIINDNRAYPHLEVTTIKNAYIEFSVLLNGFNTVSVLARLMLSMVFGGIIGMEREIRRHPAGFRTYMLVCVGSALVMMTNEFIILEFGGSDPARLGAQVISGIGFLGAGTIIVTQRQQVKGLTTAASLWACACMGLAIGIGFYQGAVITAVLILIIVTFMNYIENKFVSNRRFIEIYLELNEKGNLSDVLTMITDQNIQILKLEIVHSSQNEQAKLAAVVAMQLPRKHPVYTIMNEIKNLEGISYITNTN